MTTAFAAYARMVCTQQSAAIDALKAENPGKNVQITFLLKYRHENLDEWATFKALWTQNHPMESESDAEIQRLRALCYDGFSLEFMWKDYQECCDEWEEEESTMRERWSWFKTFLEDSYHNRGAILGDVYEDPNEIPQSNESGNESDPDWICVLE
jgi:hypothetical protein